jgi:hypothetical protein
VDTKASAIANRLRFYPAGLPIAVTNRTIASDLGTASEKSYQDKSALAWTTSNDEALFASHTVC